MIEGPAEIKYEEVSWENVPELKLAKEHFETVWDAKQGLASAKAQTGEPYVVVVPGGLKEQGKNFPIWCSSIDVAVSLWRKAVYNYADTARCHQPHGESGTLYWRNEPSLCTIVIKDQEQTTRLYTVYSRLLISDSPEIQAA